MEEASQSALFEQLKNLDTEQRNQSTLKIDTADAAEIVRLINEEDKKVAFCVEKRLNEIAEAVQIVSDAFSNGGRLFYFGAGTSGRLGVVDSSECPPTFGTHPDLVQAIMAGGEQAMFKAKEGAEDSREIGAEDVVKAAITSKDVVCGIAASGRTPYVLGAVEKAMEIGCKTLFVTTVPKSQLNVTASVIIDVPVGPEVIMGSTRMKSGTAQKLVLNMITTGAMIRQGKIYENVMVDLMLTNKKLEERAKRIVMTFSEVSYDEAAKLLADTGGHVKTALVMALTGLSKTESKVLLEKHKGFIRNALKEVKER